MNIRGLFTWVKITGGVLLVARFLLPLRHTLFSRLGLLLGTSLLTVGLAAGLAKDDKKDDSEKDKNPPVSITQTFTWTPAANEALGKRTLTFAATDDQGHRTQKQIIVDVLPAAGKEPILSRISVIPDVRSATVRWQTDQRAAPQVDFDVKKSYRHAESKSEAEASQDHELVINQLLPCTLYQYQVKAKELVEKKEGKATAASFTTKGCPGEAAVRAQASDEIIAAHGGTLTLTDGDQTLTLTAPPAFADTDAVLQAHKLESGAALAALPPPAGVTTFSDHVYEIGALTDVDQPVTDLRKPITLTINFAANLTSDENNLKLYHWLAATWQAVENCQLDTTANTISCPLASFSPFALFGLNPTPTPSPTPLAPPSKPSGSSSSGGGGGGGGGGGDDGGGEPQRPPSRTITFQAETGHRLSGSFSGIEKDSGRTVIKLAHPGAVLQRRVSVPAGNYRFLLTAKHDRPGPVDIAIFVNNRLVKIVRLDKNDNAYRTHEALKLNNFSGGTIRFQFRNDAFDRRHPTAAEADRNAYIDKWALTTAPAAPAKTTVSPQAVSRDGSRSAGWSILPNLNTYIERLLGRQFITFDIWQYYARRLTLPTNSPAAIQTVGKLEDVMRFWQGTRPRQPRGD
ncbi:MAG: hypothetical protein HY372_00225 [Candidatus Andersenbacteria bacterium]|nr:hypothetical protein [Candidatus Andersenbacteria bacterium]